MNAPAPAPLTVETLPQDLREALQRLDSLPQPAPTDVETPLWEGVSDDDPEGGLK